jgi:alkylation response protein AidB-like acyl-CoA dehydrogenase
MPVPLPLPKIFTIFEGTSEIQQMIIGRAVTGLDVR